MAKAIAHRLMGQSNYSLSAASPSLSIGVNQDNIRTHFDNKKVINNADIIILAVKPGNMASVLADITPVLPSHCLLVSIATGLNLDWFAKHCRAKQALIRTMPNTPAAVGLAATPMVANQYVSEEQKQQAKQIFSFLGLAAWVQEEEIDTYTALSGSGPAYVFSFLEAMVHAGVTLGLEKSQAEQFSLQTFAGAVKLAQSSDLSFAELRAKVTSPGGTTAAALGVLHNPLRDLILSAIEAAKNRAVELGGITPPHRSH